MSVLNQPSNAKIIFHPDWYFVCMWFIRDPSFLFQNQIMSDLVFSCVIYIPDMEWYEQVPVRTQHKSA